LGSLEDDFLYALMGQYHLMLYPYITLFLCVLYLNTRTSGLEGKHRNNVPKDLLVDRTIYL
jgi:hypothetical protein